MGDKLKERMIMKKIYIYTKETTSQLIDFYHLEKEKQIKTAFPEFNPQKHMLSESEFINPIVVNNQIREMTDIEMAENGRRELKDGEKLVNGKLEVVPCPNKLHSWNKTKEIWEKDQNKFDSEWTDIRSEREKRLKETDYLMFPDITITEIQRKDVETYRQALRDIPENNSDPLNIKWPVKPKFLQ